MRMVLVSVAEAAELLGRDRSGLHRLVKNGQAVADAQGRVLVAGDRLVASLDDLVESVAALADRVDAAERAARRAQDEADLLNLEYGEFKARSSTQLKALVEAHDASARALEAGARAMRELAPPA